MTQIGRAELLRMGIWVLVLSIGFTACNSFSRVQISKDEFVELRLIADSGVAHYGIYSFEKMSPFNQFKSASSSFTDDMNGKVESLQIDLEKKIPGSILFKKDAVRSYYYKFDTTQVLVPYKIRIYNNGVFKREIDVRNDQVMKSIIINFN